MMIDFSIVKKQKRVYPHFEMMPPYINKYNGIILEKWYSSIKFIKFNKPVGINIFNQLYPSETQHSKILCELLSPNGKHNMGNKFLELFFKSIIKDIPFNNKETWIVTAEKDRLDIKIKNIDDTIIIILENKSNSAGDQPNQIYRYWYYRIHTIQTKIKSDKTKYGRILYISPDYNKQPDGQTKLPPKELLNKNLFIPDNILKTIYFHDDIDKWLEECLNEAECKSDVSYYLKQYKDFWRFYYVV
jgi:hypothetical protein